MGLSYRTDVWIKVILRGIATRDGLTFYSNYSDPTYTYKYVNNASCTYFTNTMKVSPKYTNFKDTTTGKYTVAFRKQSGSGILPLVNNTYQTLNGYATYGPEDTSWSLYTSPGSELKGYILSLTEAAEGSTEISLKANCLTYLDHTLDYTAPSDDKSDPQNPVKVTNNYYSVYIYVKSSSGTVTRKSDEVYFPSEYQRNQYLTKEGYSFSKYNCTNGNNYEGLNPTVTDITQNVEFYPNYTANTYKYKLDPNGGTLTGSTERSITYDSSVALPTEGGSGVRGKITRSGYKFKGWYEGNTKYDTEFTWKRTNNNLVLTAKWESSGNTITYKLDNYKFFDSEHKITKDYLEQTFNSGTSFQLKGLDDINYDGFTPSPSSWTRETYTGTFWTIPTYSLGATISPSTTTTTYGDVTLSLKGLSPIIYDINYTVTPTLNYVTTELIDDLRKTYNVVTTFSEDYSTKDIYKSTPTPISWGYNLVNREIDGQDDLIIKGPYFSCGTKTVISKYSPAKYTFKFDGTAVTALSNLDFYTDISIKTPSIPISPKPGFKFLGWYLGNNQIFDGEGNPTTNGSIFYKKDTNYYLIKKQDTTKNINEISLTSKYIPEGKFKVYNGSEWKDIASLKVLNSKNEWLKPISAQIYTGSKWVNLPVEVLSDEEK